MFCLVCGKYLGLIFLEDPSTWAEFFSSVTSQVLYLLNTLKHANVSEKVKTKKRSR